MLRVILCCYFAISSIFINVYASDESAKDMADSTVANILFEYEGSDEFASYKVNESGFVDIIFARDMPEKLYGEILTKLQNSKNIDGVLSSKTGPSCNLW